MVSTEWLAHRGILNDTLANKAMSDDIAATASIMTKSKKRCRGSAHCPRYKILTGNDHTESPDIPQRKTTKKLRVIHAFIMNNWNIDAVFTQQNAAAMTPAKCFEILLLTKWIKLAQTIRIFSQKISRH